MHRSLLALSWISLANACGSSVRGNEIESYNYATMTNEEVKTDAGEAQRVAPRNLAYDQDRNLENEASRQMSLKISRVDESEIETLLDLVQEYYAFDEIKFDRESIQRALLVLIGSNNSLGTAFLFKNEQQVVGYGVLTLGFDHEIGGRVAVLTDFYLNAISRRNGYGKKALVQIERTCLQMGVRAIELQVSAGNKVAKEFYEKIGFKAFERVPMAKILK